MEIVLSVAGIETKFVDFDLFQDKDEEYLIFKLINLSRIDYKNLVSANKFQNKKIEFKEEQKFLIVFLDQQKPQYVLNLSMIYNEIKDLLLTKQLALIFQNKNGETYDKSLEFKLK